MSGVRAIRYLLATHAPLTAMVPAARIMAGVLPLDVVMPAISVSMVSAPRPSTVGMHEAKRLVRERVQVSVMVKNSPLEGGDYKSMVTILDHARRACAHQSATINTVTVRAILPDLEGPDIPVDDTGTMMRSQDFLVLWEEAR